MIKGFTKPLLPEQFDINEWYILIVAVVLFVSFVVIPKRFPKKVTLNFFLFNLYLSYVVDHLLAMPPHNFYDIMDKPSFEIFDLIIYLFLYSIFGYFLIYVYDYLQLGRGKTFVFIIIMSCVATVLELVSDQVFNVFTYFEWKITYSFFSYILLFGANIGYYKWLIRKV